MSNVIKVGIFVTLCLAVLAYLIVKVEDWNLFGGAGQRVDVVFDSVVGLDDKAPVRVAGVRVGRVDGVTLDGRKARVSLLLDTPVPLVQGSVARIANAGLLGDKYIEIVPGPEGAPALPRNALLPGETPPSFDDAFESIGKMGDSISELTGSLNREDVAGSLSELIAELQLTVRSIREMVDANRDEVGSTVRNFETFSATLSRELPRLTEQMNRLLTDVDAMVAENRGNIHDGIANIRDITDRVQTSVDNLNSITSQIASGEGSLGKLVYDDTAHDSLVSTLGSVEQGVTQLTDTLGRVSRMQFTLGLEGSYFAEPQESRTALSLLIDPGKDRFYNVELVDSPSGRTKTRTDVITTTFPDGTSETQTITTERTYDDFTLSAQFGFRFDNTDLRAGLFESTGGGAIDQYFLDRRLRLSVEAFDFSRSDDLDPRLRIYGRWQFNPNLYLVGGYDDLLESDRSSVFFGGGVRWKDEDLKYLLGSIPKF
ncbi:MAG: MCE family protein [Acidobacteria bacterium]|nr:MCE family protein [Acidobacteriota bacterium]